MAAKEHGEVRNSGDLWRFLWRFMMVCDALSWFFMVVHGDWEIYTKQK